MARRLIASGLIALAALAASATAVAADGLPVGNVDVGPGGVSTPAGDVRHVALPAGASTLALAVRRDGGQVVRSLTLRGRFVVPAVALDGSPGGLSADGSTLALIRPRAGFPRARTALAVIDARRMRLRRIVDLRGDFSFDAVSPDGRLLYLVHYTSRRDPTRYEVLAYDTSRARLLPRPIIDPRQPDEDMRGFPVTRSASPDGRWAYTLYDGGGKHPFIHALDTRDLTAACIDLDMLGGRDDIYALRLAVSADGSGLDVLDRRRSLALVDTKTFRVSAPDAGDGPASGEGGLPRVLWIAALALLLGGAAAALVARRRSTVAPT